MLANLENNCDMTYAIKLGKQIAIWLLLVLYRDDH
jgi:hypothetical protein